MPRIPPAARQLIIEVVAFDPDVHAEGVGEPDGYGITRDVRFTRADWLADALDILEDDERIETHVKENQASTLVTFVGDPRADFTHEFGIKVIAEILTSPSDEGDAEPEEQEGQEDAYEEDRYDDEGNQRQPRH